jgi:hypothetical protein
MTLGLTAISTSLTSFASSGDCSSRRNPATTLSTTTTTFQLYHHQHIIGSDSCNYDVWMNPVTVPPFVAHASSSMTLSSSTSVESIPSFEPQLNVPAFGAFFFIAVVFGFLQYRIAAIGKAADQRTAALTRLRELKSLEIAGSTNITAQNLEKAKDNYRMALEKVETLRTVIPGIARIAPPPSESENRQRMEENVAAAKQFLDMDISFTLPENSQQQQQQLDKEQTQGLSPVLLGTLAVVGLSQVALLLLFVFGPDPGSSY